jgi:hypothetical protein
VERGNIYIIMSKKFKYIFVSESKNSVLEAELRSLQRRLARRDNEILKQERELHKLRVSQEGAPQTQGKSRGSSTNSG